MDEFEDKCNGFLNDFLSSLDSNLNTPLALTSFMKLVSYVNNLSSSEKLTIGMSYKALPIVDTIMHIIGIKIMEIDNDTKFKIEEMIDRRDNLRAEKKFQAADNLRKKIFELFDVELTDHSKYTSWKKKERIEFECEDYN
jgi:cysteinyl-tRNA synthetase